MTTRAREKTLISVLTGRRAELTIASLLAFTAKYPFITLKTIGLIHWHAFLLWLKRVPFHFKEANTHLHKGCAAATSVASRLSGEQAIRARHGFRRFEPDDQTNCQARL